MITIESKEFSKLRDCQDFVFTTKTGINVLTSDQQYNENPLVMQIRDSIKRFAGLPCEIEIRMGLGLENGLIPCTGKILLYRQEFVRVAAQILFEVMAMIYKFNREYPLVAIMIIVSQSVTVADI
ncbi:hypothetical protein KKD19_05900 [Patescibacteria group bacterium]|nr:hypothetical protein [Patescibacteria group bacterium]MBU4512737.1 hypothetical protein [Patescibacteria group bacterium]MCG2693077.1 hypothetical protein [Candidatus Parcubacteria bacterium]